MIEKPTIIITSIGRTGTKFFGDLFREIIPDSTSLHEPDFLKVIRYRGAFERIRQIIKQNAKVFCFEDIFGCQDGGQRLADLVQFVTTFPHIGFIATDPLEACLDRRVQESIAQFPLWEDWSPHLKQQFRRICGPLMEVLGYAFDHGAQVFK